MSRSLGMPSGASVRPVCKPQKKKKKKRSDAGESRRDVLNSGVTLSNGSDLIEKRHVL